MSDGVRDEKGRFLPGKSGNPAGISKTVRHVALLAREYTAEAVRTLAEIMGDPGAPPSARVSAANSILDRGYGKAPQKIEVDTNALRDDELDRLVRDIASLRDRKGEGEDEPLVQ